MLASFSCLLYGLNDVNQITEPRGGSIDCPYSLMLRGYRVSEDLRVAASVCYAKEEEFIDQRKSHTKTIAGHSNFKRESDSEHGCKETCSYGTQEQQPVNIKGRQPIINTSRTIATRTGIHYRDNAESRT